MKSNFRRHLILYFFLFTFFQSFGDNLLFRHLGVDKGLSQSWVKCITQDNDGLIWFGTSDGLNRYDGYDFEVFRSDNKHENSLVGNDIITLYTDDIGNVWVGTTNGLTMFDQESNSFITHPRWPRSHINTICISDSTVHVGGMNGVSHFNRHTGKPDERFRSFQNLGFQNISVFKICIDSTGRYWFATDLGVFVIDLQRKSCEHIRLEIEGEHNLEEYWSQSIEFDHKGRLWIGTLKNGLFMAYNPEPKDKIIRVRRMGSDLKKDVYPRVLSMKLCNSDEMWLGIENNGLVIVKDHSGILPSFEYQFIRAGKKSNKALSNNSVYSIYEDRTGGVWLGQYAGGVSYYSPLQKPFMSLSADEDKINSLVSPIVNVIEEADGYIWFGTEEGISSYNSRTKTFNRYEHKYNDNETLSSNSIWAILPINKQRLLIGSWGGGVNILNIKTGKIQRNVVPEIEINNVFSLLESSQGEYWIGTMGQGLLRCDKDLHLIKQYKSNYSDEKSLSSNYVRKIIETTDGKIWISTSDGVEVFNETDESFQDLVDHSGNSLSSFDDGAYDLYEDSRGKLWIGTSMGILQYDIQNKKLVNYSHSQNESYSLGSVKSIIEDDAGNLWIGSNDGIYKVDPNIHPDSTYMIKFDHFDGLGNEFNRRSVFKTKSGILFFGTLDGVNYFDPSLIRKNETVPNIIFTQLDVNNQVVNYREKGSSIDDHINDEDYIKLTSKHSIFSIHYSGLSYLTPEKNQYAYRLKGFEEEWNYVGNRRYATYTNMNSGVYQFEVKACNNDGVWSEEIRSITIEIIPPWWRTGYAYAFYIFACIILSSVFLNLYRLRVNEKQELLFEKFQHEKDIEQNKQRLQFFTNISHEFRTPLTFIIGNIDEMRREGNDIPEKIRDRMNVIYRNSVRLNRLVSELMDFRKLEHNKLEMKLSQQDVCAFTQNISSFFVEESAIKKISFETDIPSQARFLWFDQSMLEKVLFNLLSNAFKATTEEGAVSLNVDIDAQLPGKEGESWVCISIKDNGIGLSEKEQKSIFEDFYQVDNSMNSYYSGTGVGLSLALSLVKMHKGHIKVESTKGVGSTFSVWLRKGRDHFSGSQYSFTTAQRQIHGLAKELQSIKTENAHASEIEESKSKLHTILVIEDNRELRSYIASELKSDYKIVEAKDGNEGYEKAQRLKPDCIISDLVMPNSDGFDLCENIRNNELIAETPVIILTARDTSDDRLKSATIGADLFVSKPFDVKVLKAQVENLIRIRNKMMKNSLVDHSFNMIEVEEVNSADKDFVQKLTAYIYEHMSDQQIQVDDVAEGMSLSRSQLYRKVKTITGYSATEFIRNIRLERAREILMKKSKSVNEVSAEVGFNSSSYFTKCYKKYFGKLPSEEE